MGRLGDAPRPAPEPLQPVTVASSRRGRAAGRGPALRVAGISTDANDRYSGDYATTPDLSGARRRAPSTVNATTNSHPPAHAKPAHTPACVYATSTRC